MELESFTIEDAIEDPLRRAVEVTLQLSTGERRWCFFATPGSLAIFGDYLRGTKARVHFGSPHMIIVDCLTADIIGAALKQIDEEGLIRSASLPIKPDTNESDT